MMKGHMDSGAQVGPAPGGTADLARTSTSTLDLALALLVHPQRSELVKFIADEADGAIPLQLGISADAFEKWRGVARGDVEPSGVDWSAGDAADVLRVAAFLQDETTRQLVLVAISARLVSDFQASQAFSTAVHASREPAEVVDDGKVAEVLCMVDMHPHDLFDALRHVPLSTVAHLPPILLVEALVSHTIDDAAQPPEASGCTEASRARPAAAGTLRICDTSRCEAANVLFHAPHITAGMLRTLCITTHAESGQDVKELSDARMLAHSVCGLHSGTRCPLFAKALAATLRAHAAHLRHLTLSRVSLSPDELTTLAAALDCPAQRLQSLCLRDVDALRAVVDEDGRRLYVQGSFAAVVNRCCHLTWLEVSGCSMRPRRMRGIALPRLPRLRHLVLTRSWTDRSVLKWGWGRLTSSLEFLDLSHTRSNVPEELLMSLTKCPRLRVLRADASFFPDSALPRCHLAALERLCFMHTTVSPHVADRMTGQVPTAWLGMHRGLREVEFVLCDVWGPWWVDCRELAAAAAKLRLLTRLSLQFVAVNGWDAGVAAGGLVQAQELQELTLWGMGLEDGRGGAGVEEDENARFSGQAHPAMQHPLTAAQQQFLDMWRSCGSISPTGCMHANHAPHFVALRTLDLAANHFRDCAGIARHFIAAAPRLTRLDLGGNEIGAGLRAARRAACTARHTANPRQHPLLAALAGLSELRRLNLAWNDIDDDGALCVLRAVAGLQELQYVDLQYNELSAGLRVPAGKKFQLQRRGWLEDQGPSAPAMTHSTQHACAGEGVADVEAQGSMCVVDAGFMIGEVVA